VRRFASRPKLLATFQAERIEPLSARCTGEFLDVILQERDRLEHLPFALLARRALQGEPLSWRASGD
jgi:hypothetical protein